MPCTIECAHAPHALPRLGLHRLLSMHACRGACLGKEPQDSRKCRHSGDSKFLPHTAATDLAVAGSFRLASAKRTNLRVRTPLPGYFLYWARDSSGSGMRRQSAMTAKQQQPQAAMAAATCLARLLGSSMPCTDGLVTMQVGLKGRRATIVS